MTEEIIEIGFDGSFNIPSPSKKERKISEIAMIEPTEEEIEAKIAEITKNTSFDSMKSGDYKIYQENNQSLIILIYLCTDEKPINALINDTNILKVKISESRLLSIELPNNVKISKNSLKCTYYQQYFTAKVSIVN